LPAIAGATAVLIAGCALMGEGLARLAHLDAFTAYLATSPGGLDTVTIIALSGGADVPIVVLLQTARILIVIATAPMIARTIARL
jgi:membrane AbrB-like protein